jgi:hypothetical protein
MIIEELRLLSFKGFRDFSVQFSPFTCLVGPNNSGKTSVLHAVQLLHDIFRFAFGGGPRPDFGNIRWTSNPSESLQRLTLDPDALWLHKKTAEPCKIQARLSSGIEIHLDITGRSRYSLSLTLNGSSVTESQDVVGFLPGGGHSGYHRQPLA